MDGSSFLELDAGPAWKRRVLEGLRLTGPGADLGVQVRALVFTPAWMVLGW
jgi:hypothetical protein